MNHLVSVCCLGIKPGSGNNKNLERKKKINRKRKATRTQVHKWSGNWEFNRFIKDFFAPSNCLAEEKPFIHVRIQWWFEENGDSHTCHVFPSCQECEEMGCPCPTCWPSQAHEEKTWAGRCEHSWICLPTRENLSDSTAKFTSLNISATSQLPHPGVHAKLRSLVCGMSPPKSII